MTPAFTARRRAEEFNSLVEAPSTRPLHDARHTELLQLVGALRATPSGPAPRADFVADLRSRLMVAAETALAPDTTTQVAARTAKPTPRTKRERRIAIAVGGFAIVSATSSMAVAAQSALPGETLYPLKRAIENAQVSVQSGDDKGATLLDNASGRLDEVDELSRTNSEHGDDIATTLDDFASQASAASDLLMNDYRDTGRVASLEELRSFASASMEQLNALENLVPVEARGSLIKAAKVLTTIDELATRACPSCSTTALTQAPVFNTAARLIDPLAAILSAEKSAPKSTTPSKAKKNPRRDLSDDAPTSTQQPQGQDQPGSANQPAPEQSPAPTHPVHPQNPNVDNSVVGDIIGGLTGNSNTTASGGRRHGGGGGALDGVQDLLDEAGTVVDGLLGGGKK